MRHLLKNIVILFWICQSFNLSAQIQKQILGTRVTFDTAAVIHIDTYRQVKFKIETADNLIDSLIIENKTLYDQMVLQDSLNTLQGQIMFMQQTSIARKDSVNLIISANFNALYTEATKKKPWYKREIVYYLGGTILTIFIVK